VPVLLVICNPDSNECLWVEFDPGKTTGSRKGWHITIPFENNFRQAKSQIVRLLPETHDSLNDLQDYWALNKVLKETGYKLFAFGPEEVRALDTSRARAFFDRLRASKELAYACKATVE